MAAPPLVDTPWTVRADSTPPALGACFVEASATQVGTGATVDPTVRLRDPSGTATTAHVDATWEATGGGGAVTPAATAAARLHRAARGRG